MFDAERNGSGTNEWAELKENIARGCPHNCLYCYAAENANRFKLRARSEWMKEELSKRAQITHYPKRKGVIMFPTAHDITPFNLETYVRVARLMLEAGNHLLIVSKPHLACIQRLCSEFAAFKDVIQFRFTIGTTDEIIAAHWEPGAPSIAERIASLAHAHAAGFMTSVSAEPLLGGVETAQTLLAAVRPHVTDTVWIGKMNRIRSRVDMSSPENSTRVAEIEAAQSDSEIQRMYRMLSGDPIVRWKDSIRKTMAHIAASGEA